MGLATVETSRRNSHSTDASLLHSWQHADRPNGMEYEYTWFDAGFRRILLAGHDGRLSHLLFEHGRHVSRFALPKPAWTESPVRFREEIRQLRAYFAGSHRTFDVPLVIEGTEFQRSVWTAMIEIPYGEVATYGELAKAIGRRRAARAVGAASGSNPISIIIPCHRVIGASGQLTGYGGGLDTKERLLKLEQTAILQAASSTSWRHQLPAIAES